LSTRLEIPVDGGALAAFRFGPGDGEPVIAIHGITANSASWVAVDRALGARASLVALDLRGRGASNRLPGPYGIAAHARDALAALDALGVERGVVAGHSLGAYIAARLAAEHPERVRALILVDGGLRIAAPDGVDPQALLAASLGPAVARLQMQFASSEEYERWWRAHPAFAGGDVDDADLVAFAGHDLVGEPPELRSSVVEEAVRADGAEVLRAGADADALRVATTLLCAPRGLLDEPQPMQPLSLARSWESGAPELREVIAVPDVNHYTLVLGRTAAPAVADAIAGAAAR
jgi:pimeloyl-ACP methyl ester carboxylesterase